MEAANHATTEKQNSWQTPQRQSPTAIFIILLRAILQLLKVFWPVLLFYFLPIPAEDQQPAENSDSPSSSMFIWIALLAASLFLAILRYWFYKFSIDKGHLEIQSGFLRRKQVSIPMQNIQAVQLEQGVWQRILGVYRVSFDSTGSEGIEAQIDALTKKKALELKSFLSSKPQQDATKPPEEKDKNARELLQYRLDAGDLIKLSLSANHLQAFLLLAAFSIQLFDDIEPLLRNEQKQVLEQYAQDALQSTLWMMSSLFLLVAIASILISAGRTFLKYHDFRFEEQDNGWRLFFGLLTRHQRFTPINKIQMVQYKANWIRRKVHLWMLTLQTIGQEASNTGIKLHLPTTSKAQAEKLASHYLPVHLFENLPKNSISPHYWYFTAWRSSFIGCILFVGVGYFWHLAAAFAVLLFFLYRIGHAYFWQRNLQWAISEEGIWRKSGVWGRQFDLLRWEKIQQIELQQTLYQRKRKLANLRLVTAGGTVPLPFLPASAAHQIADYGLYRLESQQLEWL